MKKKSFRDKRFNSIIVIKDLTIPQSIALEDMLATWQSLGSAGASRWTSFFADGDGNFRPKILYNGHPPLKTELLEEEDTWKGSEYRIDFDSIGWKLHDHEEIRELEAKKFSILVTILGTLRFFIKHAIRDIKFQIKINKIRKNDKKCQKLLATPEVPCDENTESPG
jgi:hypothetical protein